MSDRNSTMNGRYSAVSDEHSTPSGEHSTVSGKDSMPSDKHSTMRLRGPSLVLGGLAQGLVRKPMCQSEWVGSL
jgi:hypothetical protein